MPRYFFHTEDGQCLEDEEGTELADLDAARVEAVRIMGQLLDEDAAGLWSTESFRIVVKNETGLTLFTVDASVMSSPSASKSHLHSNGLISPEEG
jgi:hypothetical protein